MSAVKSFTLQAEIMSDERLVNYGLLWDDTKEASDHFPVIVDFALPTISPTGIIDDKSEKEIIRIKDLLGRDIEKRKNTPLFYIYDDGTVEKRIILE